MLTIEAADYSSIRDIQPRVLEKEMSNHLSNFAPIFEMSRRLGWTSARATRSNRNQTDATSSTDSKLQPKLLSWNTVVTFKNVEREKEVAAAAVAAAEEEEEEEEEEENVISKIEEERKRRRKELSWSQR